MTSPVGMHFEIWAEEDTKCAIIVEERVRERVRESERGRRTKETRKKKK
jgi:hypothetical protein